MLDRINRWLSDTFSDSDINKLLLVVAVFCAILWLFIKDLAPLIGAVLIAYVLDGAVGKVQRRFGLSRGAAVGGVVAAAILTMAVCAYALPRFLLQLRALGSQIPEIGEKLESVVEQINDYLPEDAGLEQAAIAEKSTEILGAAIAYLFNNLFSYAGDLFALFIYLILLPLLVFFLLRDKGAIIAYLRQFMPKSPIFGELWTQMDEQFGSYIRGKIIEAVIVGASTWISLLLFNMQYALALAILVGLSVLVPFVGAVAVTFPVVLFAYLQFGWSATFAWIVALYAIIQVLDGQVLVPLLFSEVIKIHPVALFSSLIFFGSLWGIWGVFFAIPLASLIKCIISTIIKRQAAQHAAG